MDKLKFFLILSAIIFSIYLVNSEHIITPSSFSANPNESFQYAVTVNNTDIGQDANITQVNITIPSEFTFIDGSNATTASGTFQNTSSVLSWTNSSVYLINGSESKIFQFNANASSLGNYNLTVVVLNSTNSYSYNISVTIADITNPEIIFTSNTPQNNAVLSQTSILLEVSATDNIEIDTITGFIYNSTRSLLSKSSTTNATLSINFTGLIDGDYYINATVNDTSGNNDSTSTRKIIINTTTSTCTPNWNYTSWSGCVSGFQMRNATDLNSCGVTTGRQSLNQSCTETCTPNWNCTDWDPSDEECEEGGTQRKTCNDLNNCNQSKPLESKICGNESGSGFWIITSLVIIFGILISAGIFFFMKNKFGSSLSPPTTVTGKFPPSGPSLKSYPRPRKIPRLPPRIPRLPIRPMMQRPVRMMGNQRNVGNTLQKKGNFRNKPL